LALTQLTCCDGGRTETAIENAAEMLDLEPAKLVYALTHKKIQMRSEIIHKPMSPVLARDQVFSFAKYLYSTMFEWMVNKLNACTHAEVYTNFIGVLDIFGFEKFEVCACYDINKSIA
jgi:myosin heavy subunit